VAEKGGVKGCLHMHTPLQTSREKTVWGQGDEVILYEN
jgi:hypothetical protein